MTRIAIIVAMFLGTGVSALAAAFATGMAVIMITRVRPASRKGSRSGCHRDTRGDLDGDADHGSAAFRRGSAAFSPASIVAVCSAVTDANRWKGRRGSERPSYRLERLDGKQKAAF